MSLSIVVITSYNEIQHVYTLFEYIKLQTLLPNKVFVYISSCPEKTKISIYEKDYPFPIDIYNDIYEMIHNDKIDTEIISFMNSNIIPHIQRNEIIKNIFDTDPECKAILHNYGNKFYANNMFDKFTKTINFYKNFIKKIKSRDKNIIFFQKTKNINGSFISNQLTIKKELLKDIVIHDGQYICVCNLIFKKIYPCYIHQKLASVF